MAVIRASHVARHDMLRRHRVSPPSQRSESGRIKRKKKDTGGRLDVRLACKAFQSCFILFSAWTPGRTGRSGPHGARGAWSSAAGDGGAGLRARKAAFSWLGGVNYGYSGRPQVQLVRVLTVSLRVKYLAHMITYSRARQQVSPALPGCQEPKKSDLKVLQTERESKQNSRNTV